MHILVQVILVAKDGAKDSCAKCLILNGFQTFGQKEKHRISQTELVKVALIQKEILQAEEIGSKQISQR